MKAILIVLAGFSILFISPGCGNGKQDSVDSAKKANDSVVDNAKDNTRAAAPDSAQPIATTPVDKDDADFAVKAANGGMAEVAMGQLAQTNAMNQSVKEFGSMMVKDHGEAGDKLKQIAGQKNITLPATLGDKEQKRLEDLQKKTGKDFDKAYVKLMVDDHQEDIKEFKEAADKCKDPDLKAFATKTLPVLEKHLDSIQAIKKRM
jgi:putative membrane protein